MKNSVRNRKLGQPGRTPLPWEETVSRRYQFPPHTAEHLANFAKQHRVNPSVIVALAIETYLGQYLDLNN